jgi:hypothetical protein
VAAVEGFLPVLNACHDLAVELCFAAWLKEVLEKARK